VEHKTDQIDCKKNDGRNGEFVDQVFHTGILHLK
jgi:hypothetical protein